MNEQQKAGGDAGAPGLADGHRPGLSAMRRFSTENTKTPLTMSLRDLPKPSFNMGPPGQRSVPATSSTLLRNPVERGAYTPGKPSFLLGHCVRVFLWTSLVSRASCDSYEPYVGSCNGIKKR